MKTKEELCALKEEVETVNKKLSELNEEELEQVTGGLPDGLYPANPTDSCCRPNYYHPKDSGAAMQCQNCWKFSAVGICNLH